RAATSISCRMADGRAGSSSFRCYSITHMPNRLSRWSIRAIRGDRMSWMTWTRGVRAVAGAALLSLFQADISYAAGGAYVVDDSEIGKPGECKVETWASFAGNSDRIASIGPACVVSLGQPVELGTQFLRFRSGGTWGSTLILKGKTNIIPVERTAFGLGVAGGIGYDFNSDAITNVFVNVPFTFDVSK